MYHINMKHKKLIKTLVVFLSVILFIFLFLVISTRFSHIHKKYTPEFRVDISGIVNKDVLTSEDYEILYNQTGLTKIGIDRLHNVHNEYILEIQDEYFKDYSINHNYMSLLECSCRHDNVTKHVTLEKGDILISDAAHISFFHFGHIEIYIGDNKTISLNGYGDVCRLDNPSEFFTRGNYLILRPEGLSINEIDNIIDYAVNNLIGVKYRISSGIFTPKYPMDIKYSQCAHIIWYMFNKFGIDLDSNGGLIVTPKDISKSEKLELVEVYGFNPVNLWK